MSVVSKLNELGFSNASVVSQRKMQITVKVRTKKGWAYEKFTDDQAEAEAEAWALKHEPE